jgi:hypothetical protein
MMNIASDLAVNIGRSIYPRFHLEIAAVKLAKLESSVLLNEVLEKLSGAGKSYDRPSKEPVVAKGDIQREVSEEKPQEAAREVIEKLPLTLENVLHRWDDVTSEMRKSKGTLGSFLSEGTPVKLSKGSLDISFGGNASFHISYLMKRKSEIENVLSRFFDGKVTVRFLSEGDQEPGDKAGNSPRKTKASKDRLLEGILSKEPTIKMLVDTFDGELLR